MCKYVNYIFKKKKKEKGNEMKVNETKDKPPAPSQN